MPSPRHGVRCRRRRSASGAEAGRRSPRTRSAGPRSSWRRPTSCPAGRSAERPRRRGDRRTCSADCRRRRGARRTCSADWRRRSRRWSETPEPPAGLGEASRRSARPGRGGWLRSRPGPACSSRCSRGALRPGMHRRRPTPGTGRQLATRDRLQLWPWRPPRPTPPLRALCRGDGRSPPRPPPRCRSGSLQPWGTASGSTPCWRPGDRRPPPGLWAAPPTGCGQPHARTRCSSFWPGGWWSARSSASRSRRSATPRPPVVAPSSCARRSRAGGAARAAPGSCGGAAGPTAWRCCGPSSARGASRSSSCGWARARAAPPPAAPAAPRLPTLGLPLRPLRG
mmetsp:Transcript_34680/g.108032  ORF Transcript_34680/g.108032 Transcript_34680/m.108032 type:complete len:339 (-) Transcript_34680:542-1558(-)